MTILDPLPPALSSPVELVPVLPDTWWDRCEAYLERASDRLNPILVKEARQALRSRQFIFTFFLMLAAGWVWSILGLATIGPAVYYSAEGPQMLFVYHMILSFPLLVVAPYSAFHSLSSERQDRTYDLVSITSLGARQILSGKLGGIALQMMIYLSAIFPCLAFTYLLRGLDIFTIVLVVVYTSSLSLALSALGLLLATIAPLRQRHIGVSVLFALLLFGAMFFDNTWTSALVYYGVMVVELSEFWQIQLILLTVFLNFFAIVFLAARSQLVSVSQNRSTALRWALVVAQLSFVAWMAWAQMSYGGNLVYGMVYLSTIFWFCAGVFLTGESSVLSPRVKRDLPQSMLGRAFLTWFAPGPGTGLMFVTANMLVVSVMAYLPYEWIGELFRGFDASAALGLPAAAPVTVRPTRVMRPEILGAAIVSASYVIIYLGIATLIIRVLRRFTEVRLAVPVVVNVILVLFGSATPWAIQMTSPQMRNMGYTLWQITNPVWTVWEVCAKSLPFDIRVLATVLPIVAIIVWLANLPALLVELKQVRIARPPRVDEEDAAQAAALAPLPVPKSPWD
jgi:hypothetical protein